MNRKRIIHGLGRRENINKAEQPHKHDQPNHVSAQHIIYSLSYLQSISRIFSHYVHFTTNCHWLRGASCRLLNLYDVFWDKQASAIVFHIYNLTDRGAELKQSFMGERMSVSWKKERKKKRFQWSLRLEHLPLARWWWTHCRAQGKTLDMKCAPVI